MNTFTDLSIVEKSLSFKEALARLHEEIHELVFEADIGVYTSPKKLNTMENPFPLEKLYMTEQWLEKNLSAEDTQKVALFKEVNDYWEVMLYSEEEDPDGVYIPFEFIFFGDYEKKDLEFLLHFGDTTIQEKYRLAALFLQDGHLPEGTLDQDEFELDIQEIGLRIAQKLSDKITELLAPLHKQIMVRIESFKQGIQPI